MTTQSREGLPYEILNRLINLKAHHFRLSPRLFQMAWVKDIRARTPIRGSFSEEGNGSETPHNSHARVTNKRFGSETEGNMCSSMTVLSVDHEDGSSRWMFSILGKIMSLGNFYLHISPEMKITYYFISLIIFSMMKESDTPHLNFLTGKHSILNQVFVKLGWLWTLSIFAVYRLMSLTVRPKWVSSLRHLFIRFAVTTFFFWIWCQVIFPSIESYTGACHSKKITIDLAKRECLKRKEYEYHSFDISGHSYLLTFCVLILMEESKESVYFLQLLRDEYKDSKSIGNKFLFLAPLITLSYLCVVVLSMLWDFMLIITTIYYHTFLEKILGSVLAVSMWYLLYRHLFRRFLPPENDK